jgi:hypothetical protein
MYYRNAGYSIRRMYTYVYLLDFSIYVTNPVHLFSAKTMNILKVDSVQLDIRRPKDTSKRTPAMHAGRSDRPVGQ